MKQILLNDKIIWGLIILLLSITTRFSSFAWDILIIAFLYPAVQFLYLKLAKISKIELLNSANSYSFFGVACSGGLLLTESISFYIFDLIVWSIITASFLLTQFLIMYKHIHKKVD